MQTKMGLWIALVSLILIPAAHGAGTVFPSNTNTGKRAVTQVRTVYSSTNVTTGAWVQLVASLSSYVSELEIFDSSGQTLKIGVGGAGSEVTKLIILPGGNGRVSLNIPSGSRVSIRAISGTANAGEGDINFYE